MHDRVSPPPRFRALMWEGDPTKGRTAGSTRSVLADFSPAQLKQEGFNFADNFTRLVIQALMAAAAGTDGGVFRDGPKGKHSRKRGEEPAPA